MEGFVRCFPELILHLVGGRKLELFLLFAIIIRLFPLICGFSSEVRRFLSCDNKRELSKSEKGKCEDWHFVLKWAQSTLALVLFFLSARKTKQQNITSLKLIPGFAIIKAKFKSKPSHFHQETLAIAETNSQASSQPQFQYHHLADQESFPAWHTDTPAGWTTTMSKYIWK